jgi:hypothetical protein
MPKNLKHFSPKNWKFLDGKSGLSKKIKVKMGLKKQEAWVDGIVFVSGRIAFLNKLKIFHHHHYFSKE